MKWSVVLLALLLLVVGCAANPQGKPKNPVSEVPADKAAQYISRDRAVAIALNGATDAQLGDAQFVEQYRYGTPVTEEKVLAVWQVDLVTKYDLRPRSRVLVDAVTGKILLVSDPPSGQ